MSTDFLNRRMDLTHAVVVDMSIGSDDNYYELIMDTSYPVKLAGKVIKLFNAVDSYVAYYPWKLLNSEEEVILEVPYNKVYDFAGNVIHDCIGEGKIYETGSDVFTEHDYVMVIIDFDAQTLHLCSETNFKNFFLNTGKGNIKLFDVTAGDEETITVENMNIINTSDSINVDKSIFENASNFEDKDKNTYALVRSDETNVLYEVPVTGDNIHSVVPVSDINAIDINALAMNLMNFIFPFTNPASNPAGFESVGNLYSLFEINGQFTDEFIEKYCYTKDEIESFRERCNNASGNSFNLFSKFDQTENKENYVYVLATDGFSLGSDNSECTSNHIFGVINKKTKKYAVTEINTVSNLINGKAGDLPISKNPDTGNLIGSWWAGDKFSPSMVMYVQSRNKRSPRLYVNTEEQTNGNNYTYSYKYMYDSYDGSQQINPENTKYRKEGFVIIGNNRPNDTQAYELNEYKHAKRFIEFFSNDDTEYADVIKRNALAPMAPNGFRYPLWLNNYDGGELINAIAMNLVVEFAEPFEHVLFDSDTNGYIHADQNIHNFTTFGDGNVTDETRTNYRQAYISCLNAERINALVYSLVDCDATGKSYYCTTGLCNDNTSNLAKLDTAVINGISHKLKFKSCMSITKDSHANLVTQSIDNNINNFMITPITRIICGSIDKAWTGYDDSKPDGNIYSEIYNNAQIKYQTFYIYKKINFANEKISFADGSSIQLAYQDSISTKQDLFIITKVTDSEKSNLASISGSDNAKKYIKVEPDSNKIIFKPATLGGDSYPNIYKRDVTVLDDQCTPDNGVSYLYYFNEYTDIYSNKHNILYRVKYYYKDTSNTFDNSFDYLSQPVEVCSLINGLIESNTNNIYSKAFIGSLAYESGTTDFTTAVANANAVLTSAYPDSVEDYENKRLVHIALAAVQYFKFYPYDIYNDLHVFRQDYNQEIAINWIGINTSTSGLTLGSDEFVCWNLSPFSTDWALKNMLGNDVVLYQNSKAPHVSNTKYDGNLVYTVETYNKYLKDNSISTLFEVKELEYLRGTGIRDDYLYKPNTRTPINLYQFYLNWYTRDLAMNPDISLKGNLNRQMCFIAKDAININDAKIEWTNVSGTEYRNIFKNKNTSEPIEIKYYGDNMSYVKCEINSNNILGFNQSVLNKYNKDSSTAEDITDKYIEKNPIFVNEIIAGNKKTYSIAMNSVNSYEELTNPSIYSIYGNSADMQVDKIDWNSLLVALNNNYKLDILTDSLISFKNQLNTFIYSNCININDSVEYSDSKDTENDILADSSIDPEYPDPFPPGSSWYKTKHGTYDSKHDIYTYYPGYGFNDITQKRNNDERGVIVFVSDDSYVTRDKHGSGDPDIWTYDSKYPNVYPKRMYVSADGIVCTKDFYDLGSIFNDNNNSVDLHDLISRITALEEEVARLRNNT